MKLDNKKSGMSRLDLSNNRGRIIEAFLASNFASVIAEELTHAARQQEKLNEL